MSKKGIIFVEGDTELALLEYMLPQISTKLSLSMSTSVIRGSFPLSWTRSFYTPLSSDKPTHELFLVNCGCDDKVLGAILERYDSLVSAGHSLILGLRDLYPLKLHQLHEMIQAAKNRLPSDPVSAKVIIAVHEVEAWFIGEYTHFNRYHLNLNDEAVNKVAKIDIATGDIEKCIPHPASTLNQIYSLVGGKYRKGAVKANKTLKCLDLDFLYLESRTRLRSLDLFLKQIDSFLETPADC